MKKILIKKNHVAALMGLIFIMTGYLLFSILLDALISKGWFSVIMVVIFLGSFIYVANYFIEYRHNVKLAGKIAKEVVKEEMRQNTEIFNHTSPEILRSEIEKHLINKIEEEEFTLWRDKK